MTSMNTYSSIGNIPIFIPTKKFSFSLNLQYPLITPKLSITLPITKRATSAIAAWLSARPATGKPGIEPG